MDLKPVSLVEGNEGFMSPKLLNAAAALESARQSARPVEHLSKAIFAEEKSEFDLKAAYQIQGLGLGHRLRAGDRITGYKMGLTSKAKMQQMGLHQPIYGVLLKSMQVSAGNKISLQGKIHPKIEPEVAFRLQNELGPEATRAEALAAIAEVAPALEILDSRYRDFQYFSLEDVVADNSSSCEFVVGQGVSPSQLKVAIDQIPVQMKINQEVRGEALSSAALGDPLESLLEQARLLWQFEGKKIPAGTWVLTGALTAAVKLEPGMVIEGVFGGLRDLKVEVERGESR